MPATPQVLSEQGLFIPIPVQREADTMARETGIRPAITQVDNAAIRLTHVNGRLRIEAVFRRSSSGWKRSEYQLFQDDERRATPKSWPEYAALLERLPSDAAGPAALPELTPLDDQTTLPTEILRFLGQCEKRLRGREGASVSVGRDSKGRYVLAIGGPKASMHMTFETQRRHGRKCAQIAPNNSIRVVTAEGEDLTEEIQGKLNKALARLLSEPPGGAGTAEAGTGTTQGAHGGGPSDRKGTVLRL